MKEKKQKLILVLFLIAIGSFANAQESLNAAGGNAAGDGGTVAYSYGQLVYNTNADSQGSIAQGVQQPFEISTILGNEHYSIHLSATIYPNPTVSSLTLAINDYNLDNLQYQLFDVNGRLIRNENISNTSTIIDMQQLQAAVYLLKVIEKNKELKSFKVIKAQ
jgi:hypothetical protein